jgi:hypothetical protein
MWEVSTWWFLLFLLTREVTKFRPHIIEIFSLPFFLSSSTSIIGTAEKSWFVCRHSLEIDLVIPPGSFLAGEYFYLYNLYHLLINAVAMAYNSSFGRGRAFQNRSAQQHGNSTPSGPHYNNARTINHYNYYATPPPNQPPPTESLPQDAPVYQHPRQYPQPLYNTNLWQTPGSQPTHGLQNMHTSGNAETVSPHQGAAVTLSSTPQAATPVVYSSLNGSQGSSTGSATLPQRWPDMNANSPSPFADSEGILQQTPQIIASAGNTPIPNPISKGPVMLPLSEVWERDGKLFTTYYKYVPVLFLIVVVVCSRLLHGNVWMFIVSALFFE